jgi:branched-chain amino acid transport system permease protein
MWMLVRARNGIAIIDWAVPLSILFAIPIMILIGLSMERGLIKYFYKRPHADQILVTFGLAIVLQEIVKYFYGANPIPTPAPDAFVGSFDFGALIGLGSGHDHLSLLAPGLLRLRLGGHRRGVRLPAFTTFGMVVRAGMADRETVGLLGSTSTSASPSCSRSPPASRALPA